MRPTPPDDYSVLRQLLLGRSFAIVLFGAGCMSLGHHLLAASVFLGGLAVVVPELLQYCAAKACVGRDSPAGDRVGRARAIHMAKMFLTLALAMGLVMTAEQSGVSAGGVLAGMVAAFAGYLVFVLGRRS